MNKIKYFQKIILDWSSANQREFPWRYEDTPNYGKLLAEFLLKRTTAKSASEFYERFITKYHSWEVISDTPIEEMEEDFKPIGLWKQRASSLKKLSEELIRRNKGFPNSRDELEALPGIGKYTASAVLLFYFGKKEPLLDSNMARVLSRFFGINKSIKNINPDKKLFKFSRVVVSVDRVKELNWGILDFSALVCHYRYPKCSSCPLAPRCDFLKDTGKLKD